MYASDTYQASIMSVPYIRSQTLEAKTTARLRIDTDLVYRTQDVAAQR